MSRCRTSETFPGRLIVVALRAACEQSARRSLLVSLFFVASRLCASVMRDTDALRVYLPPRVPVFVDKTRRFCTIGVSGAKASPTRAAVPRNRIIFYFPVTRSSVRGRARADAFCWWEKEARSKREMGIQRCASAVCVGTALNQLMALPSVQRVRNLEFGPAKWLEGKCV